MYSTDEQPRGEHGQFAIKQRTTKICAECRFPKDIDTEYYQRKGKSGKLYPNAYCKECTKMRLQNWAAKNPERVKKSVRGQYYKHRDKILAKSAAKIQNLRRECIQKLGGKCVWREGCDWTDVRALHIDHVHGGGNSDRKSVRRRSDAFYKKVLADTSGEYQLLCANHNWIKRLENEENGKGRRKNVE